MNDEEILAKGGTERDIEQYAEMNGADTAQNKPTCCEKCFPKCTCTPPFHNHAQCLNVRCTCHTTQTTPSEEWVDKLQQHVYGGLETLLQETRTAAYEKGQTDAFYGRIENMRTITIHETLDVPEPLREHFRKEGYEKGVRDSLEVVKGMEREIAFNLTVDASQYKGYNPRTINRLGVIMRDAIGNARDAISTLLK